MLIVKKVSGVGSEGGQVSMYKTQGRRDLVDTIIDIVFSYSK
jgi:hypothetical protein